MRNMTALDRIRMQIQWNRLLSVVEEQAQTLVRTAFSTSAREAGDISAGAFDTTGRMLAQAVTGTPGHVNAMAASVRSFLAKYPLETMEEGDVFLTNDPWLGTGHLNDFTAVTPTFHRGRIVALFASTTHVVDIGGRGFGPDGRQVYEEGLNIPILPLAKRGEFNSLVLEIVRVNVRNPVEVEGDLYSLAACNEVGGRRLVDMMNEFELADLDDITRYVIGTSREGMLAEIRALPHGTYRNSMRIDGYERELDLVAAVTIDDTGMSVDFDGTSAVSTYGINVPITYTEAYASFGVRCVIGSRIPNNAGSLAPVRVTAPVGTILNAPHPCAVTGRHVIGQMLPDVVLGCLGQVIPDRVPAEGTSCLWNPVLLGGHGMTGDDLDESGGPEFAMNTFHTGGTGGPSREGRPRRDRLPLRGEEHPGRGERDHRSARLLAQGVPRGLGGGGTVPRRDRADHGDRPLGRQRVRDQLDVRSRDSPAARTQRRRGRHDGADLPQVGARPSSGARGARPSRGGTASCSRCRAGAGSATPSTATPSGWRTTCATASSRPSGRAPTMASSSGRTSSSTASGRKASEHAPPARGSRSGNPRRRARRAAD